MGDTDQTSTRWHIEMPFPSTEDRAETFNWRDTSFFTGIVYQRSEVSMRAMMGPAC